MKKIGISSCFLYPDLKRPYFGPKTLFYLESDMANYISKEGILPVLIPDLPFEKMKALTDELDGLILQGGSDIAPETYGEEPIENGKWPGDPNRDRYEIELIDFFLDAQKPILGICRGFQILNVYFGGSLYQDIATQLPDKLLHRDAEKYDRINHEVIFEKDKFLHKIYGTEQGRVNSVHHQAVKELGRRLEVLATSEDGLIEAFQWKDAEAGKVMGVQWHPEFFHNSQTPLIDPQPVLDHFISFIN